MSHAIKLIAFFIVSVALHGAGLWAAAGRYEPREPDVPAGVAIVDRALFFRHAERIESQASQPLSATDRITPRNAGTLRPSQPDDNVARARPAAADEAEPERRDPTSPAPGVMARLDLPTVEPAPPPRREAIAPDGIDAARREPARMSGVDAAALPAATRPQAPRSVPAPVPARTPEALAPTGAARQASLVIAPPLRPSLDVRQAARAPAPEPADAADSRRVGRPLDAATQLHARLAEPVPRSSADAAVQPEAAPDVFAVEAPRLASPATRVPADVAASDEVAPVETAAALPAVPAPMLPDRPGLRGTLPAPMLAARQPQAARLADAPAADPLPPRSRPEGLRLRPTLADDPPDRATVAAAPAEAVRPAEPAAPPRPSAPRPAAADPAPVSTAAPDQLAALDPQAPAQRLSSDPPSGRDDPADRFTRAYQGGECFFPLRLASRDGAAIRGYGLRAESVDMFRQAFAQTLGRAPEVDWRPLTDAQCGGISFTRLVLGDSAPTVRIALERKELGLGQDLAGKVTGSRLEFVTLLVVDDSGVVHNVLDHLTPDAADLAFAIPVQPVDDGTDKVQLVMAIGASRALPALVSTLPMHSDDFFPALVDQTVEAGAVLEVGLEDFVILGRENRPPTSPAP